MSVKSGVFLTIFAINLVHLHWDRDPREVEIKNSLKLFPASGRDLITNKDLWPSY